MKLGVVQSGAIPYAVDQNLGHLDKRLEDLKSQGAKMVLLPEFFPTGNTLETNLLKCAVDTSHKVEDWLRERSAKLDMILSGAFLRYQAGDVYNVATIVEPDGRQTSHYKTCSPAPEAVSYKTRRNNDFISRTGLGKVAQIICAESFDPEIVNMDFSGCALILITFAIPNALCFLPALKQRFSTLPAALAKKNGVPVALSSMGGDFISSGSAVAPFARNGKYAGRSGIHLPKGKTIGPIPPGIMENIIAEIPLGPDVAPSDPSIRIPAGEPLFLRLYNKVFLKKAQKMYADNLAKACGK